MNYSLTFYFKNGALGHRLNCTCCVTFIWRKKIPELMKGIGKGVKEFKDGVKSDPDSDNKE